MMDCCIKWPVRLAIEHIDDVKLNRIHDVCASRLFTRPMAAIEAADWRPGLVTKSHVGRMESIVLGEWSQLVGQTRCEPEFVRKDHKTFDGCVASGVAQAARSQVLLDGNLPSVAPALALEGAMFVSLAPPAGLNAILQFCYFLLLVQGFIRCWLALPTGVARSDCGARAIYFQICLTAAPVSEPQANAEHVWHRRLPPVER